MRSFCELFGKNYEVRSVATKMTSRMLLCAVGISFITLVEGCFFPPQYQGQFKAQLGPLEPLPEAEGQLAFPLLGGADVGEMTSSMSSPVFSIRRQNPSPSSQGKRMRGGGPGSGSWGRMPQYTKIFILPDGIPEWGRCLQRHGDNIIFQNKRYDDGSNEKCIRCMQLHLRSRNVIQVYPGYGGLERCHESVAAAYAACPKRVDIEERRTEEITLFKTESYEERSLMDNGNVLCPIAGRYSFTYSINDGTEDILECPDMTSKVASCPRANELAFKFQRCSFPDTNMTVECLGEWQGFDPNEKYLAVVEKRTSGEARYRCAMFREEPETRRVYLAFSEDSTCRNRLGSAHEGHETWVLQELPSPTLPSVVQRSTCRFPSWATGEWQDLEFRAGRVLFKDAPSANVFDINCITRHDDRSGSVSGTTATTSSSTTTTTGQRSDDGDARFHVFIRSTCGEEYYSCLWIVQRSSNVLEYQLAQTSSETFNGSMCHPGNFKPDAWRTQGHVSIAGTNGMLDSSCPIQGEYTGVIPDGQRNICARLHSDCANPDILFYKVFLCSNNTYYLEEREYRCLGQWQENGVMFTYTQRRDVLGYECFVGVVTGDGSIYIKEAAVNCMRGQDPLRNGMQLVQTGACLSGPPRLPEPPVPETRPSGNDVQTFQPTSSSTERPITSSHPAFARPTSSPTPPRRRPSQGPSWPAVHRTTTTTTVAPRPTTWPWPTYHPTSSWGGGYKPRPKPSFPTSDLDNSVYDAPPASAGTSNRVLPSTSLLALFCLLCFSCLLRPLSS